MTGIVLAGCGADADFVTGTTLQTGIYTAVLFRITPDGQPPIDVLLASGSLTITLGLDGSTVGSLVLPTGVPGGPATVGMTGTATVTGLTVTFNQTTDSFVRQVTWNRIGTTLQINSERVGTALYDVTLQRQ
jgi:hypothetical protein